MSARIGDIWYRYDNVQGAGGEHINLRKFVVIGVTPKGVYIIDKFLLNWSGSGEDYIKAHRRLVLDHWVKKYAYPTHKEALESFIARKYWQYKFAVQTMSRAEAAKMKAQDMLDNEDYEGVKFAPRLVSLKTI